MKEYQKPIMETTLFLDVIATSGIESDDKENFLDVDTGWVGQ